MAEQHLDDANVDPALRANASRSCAAGRWTLTLLSMRAAARAERQAACSTV